MMEATATKQGFKYMQVWPPETFLNEPKADTKQAHISTITTATIKTEPFDPELDASRAGEESTISGKLVQLDPSVHTATGTGFCTGACTHKEVKSETNFQDSGTEQCVDSDEDSESSENNNPIVHATTGTVNRSGGFMYKGVKDLYLEADLKAYPVALYSNTHMPRKDSSEDNVCIVQNFSDDATVCDVKQRCIKTTTNRKQCIPSVTDKSTVDEEAAQCNVLPAEKLLQPDVNILHFISSERPFACPHCAWSFKGPQPLKRHVKTHSGKKLFQCELCLSNFSRQDSLKAHMRLHTMQKPYHCSKCSIDFAKYDDLKAHRQKHKNDPSPIRKVYSCSLCDLTFRKRYLLKAHVMTHTNERPYKCLECGKDFRRDTHLKRHKEYVHTEQKRFQCPVCSACFTTKGDVTRHARTHSGERPYTCSQCLVSFTQMCSLERHLWTHKTEKRYKCSHCPSSFTQKSALTKHTRDRHTETDLQKIIVDNPIVHADTSTVNSTGGCMLKGVNNILNKTSSQCPPLAGIEYKCAQCSLTYKSKSGLRKHIRKKHAEDN